MHKVMNYYPLYVEYPFLPNVKKISPNIREYLANATLKGQLITLRTYAPE